jgi:transposase
MAPAYAKPYVQRNKTDARDAEAICEAMQPEHALCGGEEPDAAAGARAAPQPRAVGGPAHDGGQRSARGLGRVRRGWRRRASGGVRELIAQLPSGDLRAGACRPGDPGAALAGARRRHRALEREIVGTTRSDPAARRLLAVPGIGPLVASAVLATVPDAQAFRSSRGRAVPSEIGSDRILLYSQLIRRLSIPTSRDLSASPCRYFSRASGASVGGGSAAIHTFSSRCSRSQELITR